MVILTVMSGYLDKLSGGYISKFVWALILGVFATAMGFIEKMYWSAPAAWASFTPSL